MKREIFFKKFSKENEIDEQRMNRDNCSKTKQKNEQRTQTKHSRKLKKRRHQKKSKRKRHHRESKKNDIRWFWNRKSHESESRIFFILDRETKRHKHRNTEKISNNRHSISKIIFFDRWYRWNHRRIKLSRTTNFNTSQRNFHEIVEISKSFISCERFSFSRQKKQRQ